MKGIKNSLKKLSFTRLSFRDSIQSSVDCQEVVSDIEAKRHDYKERVAKIATYRNYEFPEDAVHPRLLEAIEDLDIREDDIFLLSYPASNGHLLEDMVRLMVNKDEKNKSEILHKREKTENIPVGRLEVSNLYGHLRWLKSLKSPRLLASHLPYDLLPRQLNTPVCKIIYLARNPKDHIVAYYYHHRLKGIQISLDDFIDLYLHGYLLYGSYFDHVVSFWQLAKMHPSSVLFLSYEELKIVPSQMARLIANFLDLNLTNEELNEILAQKHSTANSIDWGNLKEESESSRKTSIKISKFQGVLGDWVNYFNPEQTRKLDDMIRIKFESQRLTLTDDASVAIKRLNKFGRLLESSSNDTNKPMANGDSGTLARVKASFRKKPIFTKDEAAFIRKKDKVVIVEERYQPEEQQERSGWMRTLVSVLCCCQTKRGYSPF